ncbi:hypothetical protein DEV92_107245 [Phyllobacterium myrsinacearum]|jgi:uncharacterized protein YchJ|nr:hypothetical protein DEV92_107245 [Phyllobacterium myrsinacearum]RZV05286.1 hypothetical protein EV654_2730 [Phyllobacterium myrsinacearum]
MLTLNPASPTLDDLIRYRHAAISQSAFGYLDATVQPPDGVERSSHRLEDWAHEHRSILHQNRNLDPSVREGHARLVITP